MTGQLNTTQPAEVMAIETRQGHSVNRIDELYSPEYFGGLSQLAGAAAKSRLFGDLTPEQLFMVLMTGREMGLPPTVALRNIGSFKGKTVISSQLQLAKVKEAGYIVEIIDNTDDKATVSVGRKGEKSYVKTFTMADATRAGLLSRNDLYKTNPSTMLLNRAIGLACRYGAPEVLNGLYNEAELVELDDPAYSVTTQVDTSRTTERATPGWSIDALSKFEELKERAYVGFKSAGLEANKIAASYEKFGKKWNERKNEPSETVLAEMEAWLSNAESKVKPTQPAIPATDESPVETAA